MSLFHRAFEDKEKYFYCKSWFWAKKRPTDLLNKTQAKQAHDKKQKYTVLVNDTEQPYAVIEIANDFVGVGFLDDMLRNNLSYQFEEVEKEKLFLSMVTSREFDGDKDQVTLGTSYIFSQDGGLNIRKQFFNPHNLQESRSSTDVSKNYESYPKFGEYAHLLKVER